MSGHDPVIDVVNVLGQFDVHRADLLAIHHEFDVVPGHPCLQWEVQYRFCDLYCSCEYRPLRRDIALERCQTPARLSSRATWLGYQAKLARGGPYH
jgi:hypothetical protein